MKKILYIGNKLASKGITETTIDRLSVLLKAEGFIVFTASSIKNKILRFLDMLTSVFRYNTKLDYVLIDTYSSQNFYYALSVAFLCRILKIPYIPILHGGNLPQRLKQNKRFSKMIFDKAFINVAPSKYLIYEFEKAGFKNLIYIPNTIEIGKYQYTKRTILKPKLLWVRSFSKIYNPLLALKIVEGLQGMYDDASLTMVGPEKDGSMKYCKVYAQNKNLNVIFKGKLSREEWVKLSKNHSIFINTTNFDNTPVSLIEAMALGLPIVSTNAGGIPFLLEDNKEAFLVNKNSLSQFIDKISFLINNCNSLKQMPLVSREKAESFDWQQVKTSWINLLK